MGKVILLSGPIGAGKTTVARQLISLLSPPLSYIEGDAFWPFFVKSGDHDWKENFRVLMRAATAAAVPFARSGYDVLLDFSAPPEFLPTARKILKDVPLDYVVLRPSQTVCAERAASRSEGAIADYARYGRFYSLFEAAPPGSAICDDDAPASLLASRIQEGLGTARFRVA